MPIQGPSKPSCTDENGRAGWPRRLPLNLVLNELWKGYTKNQVWQQCALASRVSLVSKEWAEQVKTCHNGSESFAHAIARHQYGEYLGEGYGIPRSKVLDSLYKEISLETAARRLRRPVVDCTTLGLHYTTNVSTASNIAVMAFVVPKQTENTQHIAVSCWRGPALWPDIRHGLRIYCLETARVLREHDAPCRVNAVHASVAAGIYAALQDGSLIMLRPASAVRGGKSENWDDVIERKWVAPSGAALSCMHVREGNNSLIAVASHEGIHVLEGNEGGFQLLHHIAFTRPACSAATAAVLSDITAQVVITSKGSLQYLDRDWMLRWRFDAVDSDSGFAPAVSYQQRDPDFVPRASAGGAGAPLPIIKDKFEKLLPCGRLRVRNRELSLVTHDGEDLWVVHSILGRVLDMGGDEALFFVVFDSVLVVASVHDPLMVLLCTKRAHSSSDVTDYSCLDVFPPKPGKDRHLTASMIWRGGFGLGSGAGAGTGVAAFGVGAHEMMLEALHGIDVEQAADQQMNVVPRVAISGNVLLCAELQVSSELCLRRWFGHGAVANAERWKAVKRARCKIVVQRLLSGSWKASRCAAAHDAALQADAALDFFFMMLAVTSQNMEEEDVSRVLNSGDSELEGGGSARGGGEDRGVGATRREGGQARDGEGEGGGDSSGEGHREMGEEAFRVCLEVAQVRRGCGEEEGERWLRALLRLGGCIGPLDATHETTDYWVRTFALPAKVCEEMAHSARACRRDVKLLRIPELREPLRRHLFYSNRQPCLRQLFEHMVDDSLPHRREDLEDIGRCQGREAALQEWKRRWRSTVRALFQESHFIHPLLEQRLVHFSDYN